MEGTTYSSIKLPLLHSPRWTSWTLLLNHQLLVTRLTTMTRIGQPNLNQLPRTELSEPSVHPAFGRSACSAPLGSDEHLTCHPAQEVWPAAYENQLPMHRCRHAALASHSLGLVVAINPAHGVMMSAWALEGWSTNSRISIMLWASRSNS